MLAWQSSIAMSYAQPVLMPSMGVPAASYPHERPLSAEAQLKIAKKMEKKQKKALKKAMKYQGFEDGAVGGDYSASMATRDVYATAAVPGYDAAYQLKMQEKMRKKAEKQAKKGCQHSAEKAASKAWKQQQKLEEALSFSVQADRSVSSGQPLTEKEMKKLTKQQKKMQKLEKKAQKESMERSMQAPPATFVAVQGPTGMATMPGYHGPTVGQAYEQPVLCPSDSYAQGSGLPQPSAPNQEPLPMAYQHPLYPGQALPYGQQQHQQQYGQPQVSLSYGQATPAANQQQQQPYSQQQYQYQAQQPHQQQQPEPQYAGGSYAY